MSDKDPWKNPYTATCTAKDGYDIKCDGDPKGDFGAIWSKPGQGVVAVEAGAAEPAAGGAPAPAGAPAK